MIEQRPHIGARHGACRFGGAEARKLQPSAAAIVRIGRERAFESHGGSGIIAELGPRLAEREPGRRKRGSRFGGLGEQIRRGGDVSPRRQIAPEAVAPVGDQIARGGGIGGTVLEFIGGTYAPLLQLGENFVGCCNGACAGLRVPEGRSRRAHRQRDGAHGANRRCVPVRPEQAPLRNLLQPAVSSTKVCEAHGNYPLRGEVKKCKPCEGCS